MNTLRRLVCRVFGHTTLPGVNRRWSFLFWCPRCRQLVEGQVHR